MSRVIAKGIPQYLTETKLKEHFLKHGDVTDVKILRKRNGELRKFAFVGYKSNEEAELAVKYFNGSFIDTAKIEVSVAKTFADPNVPISAREQRRRDWEKLNQQEQRLLQQEQQRQLKHHQHMKSKIDREIENNPKLKEFIETFKPSDQTQSWKNDMADGLGAPSTKELERALNSTDQQSVSQSSNELHVKQTESDEEYQDFNAKNEEEEEEEMIPLKEPEQEKQLDLKSANMSDLEWLQLKRIRMIENEQRIKELEQEELQKRQEAKKSKVLEVPEPESEIDQTIAKIQSTGRLFIRNILYTSTEDDFRQLFSKYGPLDEVHIAIDTRTSKSKGFVYIQFTHPEDAINAFKALDKQIFQGRLLHILGADTKKSHRLDEFDLKNLPLKKRRELKRKDQAAKTQFSWNSLYMNQDAVLDSVAAQIGVNKAQLIDPQNSDSAVKQALAEAHVIGDVKKYFETKGVDLTSFKKGERDDRIILVKNFEFGTTVEQLGEMFSQHGEIKRLLMPPSGTIAIVEFRDLPSARAAFTKLAYKRFKTSILYLEKGPKDLFTREPSRDDSFMTKPENSVEAKVTVEDVLDKVNDQGELQDTVDGPTVSVFIKNLNFSTTTTQLGDIFKHLPGYAMAVVKTKPDPKKEGNSLSMGFGFVEFRSKQDAEKAISVMDGHVLDGHKLQLKLSNRQGNEKKRKANVKSSKIIIKNLPFEATRNDIIELFGSFGQVKSARVPKKFDKSARGFAFVEFSMAKEAETAMNQLEGVHLLGRRLVMDYAQQVLEDAEVEIERMTKKVKRQFDTQQLAAQRLISKNKLDLDED